MDTQGKRILFAEDDPINRAIITRFLQGVDLRITLAEDGAMASKILQDSPKPFDAIILDNQMPGFTGEELLGQIKSNPVHKFTPVIFQTASDDEDLRQRILRGGAFFHLIKPLQKETLLNIVRSALRNAEIYQSALDQLNAFGLAYELFDHYKLRLKNIHQARAVAMCVAKSAENPDAVQMGMTELLANAIEHGNLGITYDEKTQLIQEGALMKEVEIRLKDPRYRHKNVHVEFNRQGEMSQITITDEGQGFDFEKYLTFDPKRLLDTHGRGIMMAKHLAFSHMEYTLGGRQITVAIRNQAPEQSAPQGSTPSH